MAWGNNIISLGISGLTGIKLVCGTTAGCVALVATTRIIIKIDVGLNYGRM